MQSIDEEWSRLTDLYSNMSEGELEKLANEAYELTDMARDVLRGEISRRGLRLQLLNEPAPPEAAQPEEPPEDFDPEDLDLVGFGRVYDLADARRTKSILDQAGVPSYFGPDNLENVEELGPLFAAADAEAQRRGFQVGIPLKVPSKYSQQASKALATAPRESEPQDTLEDEPNYLAVCPRCHSPEIVFQGVEEDGSPDPDVDSQWSWSCDACGHKWKDDGVEQQGQLAS
jgi:DNA-directed RNA polymerase subunit M/transcription elongation factor TFIIS